jgi:hypothetical protein
MKHFYLTLSLLVAGCESAPKANIAPEVAFKDVKGVSWLMPLRDMYFQCEVVSGVPDKTSCSQPIEKSSPAFKACRNLGGRLPTGAEFQGLIDSFDHNEKGLTEKGLSQLREAFSGVLPSRWYWSTTLSPKDPELALSFSVFNGTLKNHYEYRYAELGVVCVQ